MQWFKHDANANMDAKLQEVLLDYGLEGYGLYWYCIELIAGKIDKNNITFALEHDARIIARNTGCSVQKTQEMMKKFIDLGLFESSDGIVTCMKLARRLDQSMTSNPEMRALISGIKNHDTVMTASSESLTESCKNRIEENREDNNRRDNKNTKPENKFSDRDFECAEWLAKKLIEFIPDCKKPNLKSWAEHVRNMRELDKRDYREICQLWGWCRADGFESSNVQSPEKLRKRYDQLKTKMKNQISGAANEKPRKLSLAERTLADSAALLEYAKTLSDGDCDVAANGSVIPQSLGVSGGCRDSEWTA